MNLTSELSVLAGLDLPSRTVPNQFPPARNVPYRLAIIGEAPGRDEESEGKPFVGSSGRFLTSKLASAGILRDACFIGNVCQHRPPANDIEAFSWNGPEIQGGLTQLRKDLDEYNPHLCLLLGATALRASRGGEDASISQWRGSLFISYNLSSQPIQRGRKCMASWHPAACLRMYEWTTVLKFDLRRARLEAETPDLVLPERSLVTPMGSSDEYFTYLVQRLEQICRDKPLISVDIEGGVHNGISCLSIASSATDSFIIPFATGVGSYWPTIDHEAIMWRTLSRVLSDPSIPKVLQNSLYDNFVLCWLHRLPIRGIVNDTMLKHWEVYCELEKSLAFQASIYTKEPYYKYERKSNDLNTFWQYCCRDSAITYEINSTLDNELRDAQSRSHYRFNLSILNPLLYMEQRGIRYNYDLALRRRAEIETRSMAEQEILNSIAGHPVNVGSPKFRTFLYDQLGLPKVYNRVTGRPTANYEALLSLAKKTNHPVLHSAIRIRNLTTRARMLSIHPDGDGRVRCGYNSVGTDTGRVTSYTSPTGSGYNLQTIPEYDRDLFLADPDHDMFQCDLSGADAWTVAAHCASLGDPVMLDDLQAGIKIAKVLALMFREGPEVSMLSRERLLEATRTVRKNDPIYFGSKCVQHGSNYGMGKVLLSATIFIQSEGAVSISAADAERLQALYFRRYPGVRMWHDWVDTQLKTKGYLVSASGHRRIFFGRKDDHATKKAAYSNECQENTTYATNLAMHRIWSDEHNRCGDGSLRVEPLHQVHDAIVGQWPTAEREASRVFVRQCFDNELVVAGIRIKIPFAGRYGQTWKECGEDDNPNVI